MINDSLQNSKGLKTFFKKLPMISWTAHLPANTVSNVFSFKNGIVHEFANISSKSTLPMRIIS